MQKSSANNTQEISELTKQMSRLTLEDNITPHNIINPDFVKREGKEIREMHIEELMQMESDQNITTGMYLENCIYNELCRIYPNQQSNLSPRSYFEENKPIVKQLIARGNDKQKFPSQYNFSL